MWSRNENYNSVLARVLLEKLSLPRVEARDAGGERNGSLPDSSPPAFLKNLFLNWRIIALQCCVDFWCISTWISYKYTYISSLWAFPLLLPPSHPSACMCVHYVASVVSDSLQPYGPYPASLLCPWDSPSKSTGVGCHFPSRASSQPRDGISFSYIASLAGCLLTTSAPWETLPPFCCCC